MFYDLNVPWSPSEIGLQSTLAFLDDLGYNVVALAHTLSGKVPAEISCPIPAVRPFPTPSKMKILRRCTLIHSDPSQNHRLSLLANSYDILAIRPTSEKSLQQACQTLDCDIISLDLTERLDFHFKMKMLAQAVERGVMIEICYATGILASESLARRNLIGNVTQLIRATRGRGLVISSEASRAVGCRGPHDVINLAAIWGLGPERGREAISKLARTVVVNASMRRSSYRGVVDVVYGGERPLPNVTLSKKSQDTVKRKADDGETDVSLVIATKTLSKREQKRRAKKAKTEARQAELATETTSESLPVASS